MHHKNVSMVVVSSKILLQHFG